MFSTVVLRETEVLTFVCGNWLSFILYGTSVIWVQKFSSAAKQQKNKCSFIGSAPMQKIVTSDVPLKEFEI